MKRLIFAMTIAISLGGCVASMAALDHYDSCSMNEAKFERMIQCGKMKRQAYCTQVGTCSPEGNLIVQYGDSLVASLKRGEMAEAEARRKWVEFSMLQRNQQSNREMQAWAIMAATAPRTCHAIGTSVSCY